MDNGDTFLVLEQGKRYEGTRGGGFLDGDVQVVFGPNPGQ
jgi:hypothetical protein